nr:flavodoxin [Solobacterium sp.]
ARPAIGSDQIDLSSYTTVFVGYPIWWGEEPRIMDTFAENYSFEGKTVIPFCTSGSSGISRSGKNLAERAGSGTWLDGRRFDGGVSEDTLRSWIEELK